MTTLRKAVLIATATLLAGVGTYEARRTARLQSQLETLQQQQAPLLQQLAALKTKKERLSNQVASLRDADSLSPAELSELLRLRGRVTLAQADAREILQLKAALAEQNDKLPDYLLTQFAMSMHLSSQYEKKGARARLARMKDALHLNNEQVLAVSNTMMLRIERENQLEFDMMAHQTTSNDLAQAARAIDQQENELKALLRPEQLAAYQEYLQKEKASSADGSARSEAGRLAEDFTLSTEQQDKVRARLYDLNLNAAPDPTRLRGILDVATSSHPAKALQAAVELMKSQLEDKLKALGDILTPEQIQAYREEQLQDINGDAARMQLLMPRPAGK